MVEELELRWMYLEKDCIVASVEIIVSPNVLLQSAL